MTEQTRPALLPCPFCGEQPENEPWHGGAKTKRRIGCNNEECSAMPSVTGQTNASAVEAWNRRASPAQPVSDERITELAAKAIRPAHFFMQDKIDAIADAIRQALRESPVAQAEPVAWRIQSAGANGGRIEAIAPPSHAQGVAAGLELAIRACESERLVDATKEPDDVAYGIAINDCIRAIRALHPQDVVCVPREWTPVGDIFMSLEKGKEYEVRAKFNYTWTITHVRLAAAQKGE